MDIVCVGDCGLDYYLSTEEVRLGGCTFNVAMNYSFSADTPTGLTVITALAEQAGWSTRIVEMLSSRGIALCASLLPGSLPVQKIFLEQSGERIFKGYDPGILSDWKLGDLQINLVNTADVVITLAYQQIMPLFLQILALPRRGKLSVDFMDMSDFAKDFTKIEGYLEYCDIAFFGLSKKRDHELAENIKKWFKKNDQDRIAVLTFGAEGALVVGSGFCVEQSAQPVAKVVDTTGAGDSFAAVFLANHFLGKNIDESLQAASQRAAAVVQKLGAF